MSSRFYRSRKNRRENELLQSIYYYFPDNRSTLLVCLEHPLHRFMWYHFAFVVCRIKAGLHQRTVCSCFFLKNIQTKSVKSSTTECNRTFRNLIKWQRKAVFRRDLQGHIPRRSKRSRVPQLSKFGLFLTKYSYFQISNGEAKALQNPNGVPHHSSSQNVLKARRGVIRMLIIVVSTFAVCNLPLHARKMWQYWSSDYRGNSNFSALFTPLTSLVTYFNSGVNPLLYAFLSKNFRR